MTVILPQSTSGQIGMSGAASAGETPVLYLLHGLSDDDTIWLRRTSIERYVAPLGLAVVMPQVDRSFYPTRPTAADTGRSCRRNCPRWCAASSGSPGGREDTFVAGLSMGGYGAFKWALHRAGPIRGRGEPVRRRRPGRAAARSATGGPT